MNDERVNHELDGDDWYTTDLVVALTCVSVIAGAWLSVLLF